MKYERISLIFDKVRNEMSHNLMELSDDGIPPPSSRADSGTRVQDITYVLSALINDRFWVHGPGSRVQGPTMEKVWREGSSCGILNRLVVW